MILISKHKCVKQSFSDILREKSESDSSSQFIVALVVLQQWTDEPFFVPFFGFSITKSTESANASILPHKLRKVFILSEIVRVIDWYSADLHQKTFQQEIHRWSTFCQYHVNSIHTM
jgi:hypothetical protein